MFNASSYNVLKNQFEENKNKACMTCISWVGYIKSSDENDKFINP